MRTKICNECGTEVLYSDDKCPKCGADLTVEDNYAVGEISEEEYQQQKDAAKKAVYQNVKIDEKTPHVKGKDDRVLFISKIIVVVIFLFFLVWYGISIFIH